MAQPVAEVPAERMVAGAWQKRPDAERCCRWAEAQATTSRAVIGHEAAVAEAEPMPVPTTVAEPLPSGEEAAPAEEAQGPAPTQAWGFRRICLGWTRERFRRHVSAVPRRVPVRC